MEKDVSYFEHYKEEKLEKLNRPNFVYSYYVTGRGDFPYDMLRYDRAWTCNGDNLSNSRGLRSFRMRSYIVPTVERWASFGWSVSASNDK